jgi:hydrogenase maturation factor
MKPEIFFLKYAFPCSFVLLLRKEITKKEHDLLYKSAKEEKLYLTKERIEKIFWRPMKFLKSISNLDEIQKYWWFDHNFYLKKKKFKDFEEVLLEHCLVIPCEVVKVKKGKAIVKSPFLKEKTVLKTDFVNVKPENKVTKHYDFICEKISEDLYEEMVKSLKNIIE